MAREIGESLEAHRVAAVVYTMEKQQRDPVSNVV